MTAPISTPSKILRKRFGMLLKARREDLGMTQAEVSAKLRYDTAAMVSQQERGATLLPPFYLADWAEILGVDQAAFAKQYLYYCEPDIYRGLFRQDPYALEALPRPAGSLTSCPGRPAARP